MNQPLVSIIIPTHNRKDKLQRLLKSILISTYKNIEIIVVDDASSDGTFEFVNKYSKKNKKITIIRNKINLFAAGSKNVGQKNASGEFIAFIDDDNVVDKKMIKELVTVLIENNEIGEVGPVNFNYNNKNLILFTKSTRNMWTTKTFHLRTLTPFKFKKYWETDDIPNAFMVRAGILKKNKIEFKSKFGIMYEESDYAYRIRQEGYKIVMVRDARIYHDIEDLLSKNKNSDFLYHFLEDTRRPFVFARNRILFHSLYSTWIQNLFILSFWIWLFVMYYVYKFVFYIGYGDFSFNKRLTAALNYIKGTFNGIKLIIYNVEKF